MALLPSAVFDVRSEQSVLERFSSFIHKIWSELDNAANWSHFVRIPLILLKRIRKSLENWGVARMFFGAFIEAGSVEWSLLLVGILLVVIGLVVIGLVVRGLDGVGLVIGAAAPRDP